MSAVIIVDIRNFTPHCEILTKYCNIEPLKQLIVNSIKRSVKIIDYIGVKCDVKILANYNHTGDGFLVTLDTKNVSFISIYFAQMLKYAIIDEIKTFREKIKTILNGDDYKYLMHTKISYGMGIHKGEVEVYPFEYKLFDKDYTNYAFISNVINIASRIEQSTKDHGRKIICSKEVYANFEKEYFIYKRRHIDAENYFDRLGGHKYKGVDCLIYIYGVKPGLFASEAKEALMNNEI